MQSGPKRPKINHTKKTNDLKKKALPLEGDADLYVEEEFGTAHSQATKFSDISSDLNLSIAQFLDVSDIAHMSSVSQELHTVLNNDVLWRDRAHNNGVPLFLFDHQQAMAKKEYEQYAVTCKYPPEFIELFGSKEKVDALPLLKYNQSDIDNDFSNAHWVSWVNTGRPADHLKLLSAFKGHRIMRGVGMFDHYNVERDGKSTHIKTHYPFIAFCVKQTLDNDTALDIHVLYPREGLLWVSYNQGRETETVNPPSARYIGDITYFKNLIAAQSPIPHIRHGYSRNRAVFRGEQWLEWVHEGKTVELTDQAGLDLTPTRARLVGS